MVAADLRGEERGETWQCPSAAGAHGGSAPPITFPAFADERPDSRLTRTASDWQNGQQVSCCPLLMRARFIQIGEYVPTWDRIFAGPIGIALISTAAGLTAEPSEIRLWSSVGSAALILAYAVALCCTRLKDKRGTEQASTR